MVILVFTIDYYISIHLFLCTNKVIKDLEAECFLYSVSLDDKAINDVFIEEESVKEYRIHLKSINSKLLFCLETIKNLAPDIFYIDI